MIATLNSYASFKLPLKIQQIIYSYTYAFNPSFVSNDGVNYLAIRVYSKKQDEILAIVFIWEDDEHVEVLDISKYFEIELMLKKVADPKLFIMDNTVYGSFNTGRVIGDINQIILFNFDNTKVSEYYICEYDERTKVEKNWAFYIKDKELYALYSLNPLTILKAEKPQKNLIRFRKNFVDNNQCIKNCSIGTPLLYINDEYCFIAHKKRIFRGKRIYFGKPLKLVFRQSVKIVPSKILFIHSLKSLLGNKVKFNKQLISCTYFSGLHASGNKVLMSYGINDIDNNITIIDQNKVWQ